MGNQLNIIQKFNQRIDQEQDKAFGLSIVFVMFSAGIASINAAMAVQGEISIFILITSVMLAMSTVVFTLSLQPLKIVAWSFIVSVIINTAMLFYQIMIALS